MLAEPTSENLRRGVLSRRAFLQVTRTRHYARAHRPCPLDAPRGARRRRRTTSRRWWSSHGTSAPPLASAPLAPPTPPPGRDTPSPPPAQRRSVRAHVAAAAARRRGRRRGLGRHAGLHRDALRHRLTGATPPRAAPRPPLRHGVQGCRPRHAASPAGRFASVFRCRAGGLRRRGPARGRAHRQRPAGRLRQAVPGACRGFRASPRTLSCACLHRITTCRPLPGSLLCILWRARCAGVGCRRRLTRGWRRRT